jgi:hypothetical protein
MDLQLAYLRQRRYHVPIKPIKLISAFGARAGYNGKARLVLRHIS